MNGLSHHVRGAVAHQEQAIGIGTAFTLLGRDDGERAVGGEERGEVAQLAVHLGADGGLGETGTDRGGNLCGGNGCGEILDCSVGERDPWHGTQRLPNLVAGH